jgi:glycosyltransferase involved in cell wall biosynthesis
LRQAQYQTYKNKEILVVADGLDVRHLIPKGVRYLYESNFGSIGAKRNAGCAQALGEIVAHFDDDDWSGPDRIREQVAALQNGVHHVSGYHTLRFTDGVRWWRYHLRPEYVPGTTLCYRKTYWEQNRFPDLQIGEDGAFVSNARHVLTSADAGELMFATIHQSNTSPRQLGAAQWKEIEAPCSAS